MPVPFNYGWRGGGNAEIVVLNVDSVIHVTHRAPVQKQAVEIENQFFVQVGQHAGTLQANPQGVPAIGIDADTGRPQDENITVYARNDARLAVTDTVPVPVVDILVAKQETRVGGGAGRKPYPRLQDVIDPFGIAVKRRSTQGGRTAVVDTVYYAPIIADTELVRNLGPAECAAIVKGGFREIAGRLLCFTFGGCTGDIIAFVGFDHGLIAVHPDVDRRIAKRQAAIDRDHQIDRSIDRNERQAGLTQNGIDTCLVGLAGIRIVKRENTCRERQVGIALVTNTARQLAVDDQCLQVGIDRSCDQTGDRQVG